MCVCLLAEGRAQLQSKEVMQSVHIGTRRLRGARWCMQTHKYIYTSHSECWPSANRRDDSLGVSHSFTLARTLTQSGQIHGQTDVTLTRNTAAAWMLFLAGRSDLCSVDLFVFGDTCHRGAVTPAFFLSIPATINALLLRLNSHLV